MRASSRTSESGFTFIEILVSLLLLSVLGLVIWGGLSRGEGLVRRTFQGALDSARVLQLDTSLRGAAGRVRIPYWEGGSGATATDDGISVPWLDGFADRFLHVERRGTRLAVRISDEGPEAVFGPFERMSFGLLVGPGGIARGIQVTVAGGSAGAATTLEAGFGGEPLKPWSAE